MKKYMHLWLGLVAVVLSPASAYADRAAAVREYRKGMEHYNAGEFEAALDAFERAYEADPQPILQYNIAQCHWKLGDNAAAIAGYERYLQAEPNAEDRAVIEARTAALRARAMRNKRAQTDHAKAAPAPEPEPSPPPAAPVLPAAFESSADDGPSTLRIAAYSSGIAGLAALTAGVILGAMTRAADKDAESADYYVPDDYDSGERLETLQFVCLGIGGAAVVASGVMFLLDRPSEEASVAVAPVVGSETAGLLARVGF